MPLKIELQGHGAGSGELRVAGRFDIPESLSLSIQRNDGLYLGLGQVWQSTPHWHPQFSVLPEAEGLRMELGADIVDGVIDAGGVPLRVVLRMDDREDFGVLRIRGELIGSDAAAAAPALAPAVPPTPEPEPEPELELELPATAALPPLPAAEPPPRRSSKWPWVLFVLPLALLGAGGAGWYLELFDPLLREPTAAQKQDESARSEQRSVAEPGAEPPSADAATPQESELPQGTEPLQPTDHAGTASGPLEPELTGVAFVRRFLAYAPTPEAIFARGAESERAGDCDAALLLFNTAADRDPSRAAELARRFDPQGFEPDRCIDQPDAPYAIIFYGDAAAAGMVGAQRRLGQLLTAREPSGPTFEEGMEWLRRAAEAGDEQARASLADLEN